MFVDRAEDMSPETFKKATERVVKYLSDSVSAKTIKENNPKAKHMTSQ